jgi:hypothetical protein
MAQQDPENAGKPTVLRNGKQCRERWVNFLNPEIKKDPFSVQEDIFLLETRLKIGNKWAEIVKQMAGRTENNIKNRFNMLLKTMKDEAIRQMEHKNIHEVNKTVDFNENELITQLIERKKQEFKIKEANSTLNASNENSNSNFKMEDSEIGYKELLIMHDVC